MAVLTVTNRYHNVVGNRRQDYGEVTVASGLGTVHTTLNHIEFVRVISKDGDEVEGTLTKNSDSTSLTEDDEGHFHMAAFASSGTYQFMAEGT